MEVVYMQERTMNESQAVPILQVTANSGHLRIVQGMTEA